MIDEAAGSDTSSIIDHPSSISMSLLLRSLMATVVLPGTVTVGLPLALWAMGLSWGGALPAPLRLAGGAILCVGAAVFVWCAWQFAATGRGTPAPWDPPRRLVTPGLYRLTRNPMYVGVLLVLAGEALIFGAAGLALYALVVAVAFHLRVVLAEEPALRRSFGPDYEAYCRRVPRWLPRTPRAGS
jgi:protein-S-isoprenylcysteine O-methyltransferase Ste14